MSKLPLSFVGGGKLMDETIDTVTRPIDTSLLVAMQGCTDISGLKSWLWICLIAFSKRIL